MRCGGGGARSNGWEMSVTTPDAARELSPEEQEARAKACFLIESRIIKNIASGREAMWELAKNLYEFDEENGWTALGHDTQAEWLAQPEIGMTRTAYFRMVRKYRELVLRRELPTAVLLELEPSKVDIVMPTLENDRAKFEDVVEDLKSLGARDLRDKYIGPRHRPSPNGDGKDGEAGDGVIDGTAKDITTDDKPVKASDVGPEVSSYVTAGAHIESWLEMGGDRRKAQRNFRKLVREHPVFAALGQLQLLFDGEENAPSREEALEAWKALKTGLNLPDVSVD